MSETGISEVRVKSIDNEIFSSPEHKVLGVSFSDSSLSSVVRQCVSKCLLRLGVSRVFVLFCGFVYVRAILSWCP